MKKKVNLLSAVIFLVLLINFCGSLFYAGLGFCEGVRMGVEGAEKVRGLKSEKALSVNPVFLEFMPVSMVTSPETATNAIDGKEVPMQATQGIVWLDGYETSKPVYYLASLCSMVAVVFLLVAMVRFVQFIRGINRLEIFTWTNVRLLKSIGRLLILYYVLNLLYTWLSYWQVSQVFAIEGRMLDWVSPVVHTSVFLGVAALLMGEVFTLGLRMREEQELTI